MECTHDKFKCTNGVFYCLKCWAVIPNPYEAKPAPEPEKKPAKRKRSEPK